MRSKRPMQAAAASGELGEDAARGRRVAQRARRARRAAGPRARGRSGSPPNGFSVAWRPSSTPIGARARPAPDRQAVGVGRRRSRSSSVRATCGAVRPRRDGDRQRPAGRLDHVPHDVANSSSMSRKSETTCEHAAPARRSPLAMPTSSSAAAVSVGVGSPRLVRWLSVREVVKPSAPASTASRGEPAHLGDLVGGRRLAVGAALAHHVEPQRRRAAPARRRRCRSAGASSASRYSAKVSQSTAGPRAARCRGCPRRPPSAR